MHEEKENAKRLFFLVFFTKFFPACREIPCLQGNFRGSREFTCGLGETKKIKKNLRIVTAYTHFVTA